MASDPVAPASAPRIAMRTLGCKVNQVESEQVLAALLERGFDPSDEMSADVVLVNTCTVTGEADAKARKAIRHALGINPLAKVVVTGCLAALEADAVAALDERIIVETDHDRLVDRVTRVAEDAQARARGAALAQAGAARGPRMRVGSGFHTRSMVKIEDGCDAFCTYCIVPYARGGPRSVPVADVLAQCEALVKAGVSEIVLTGINLGRYADSGQSLCDLVTRVADTGIARLRLSSIEPLDLTAALLDTLATTPAFCEHLHVPLQSADDDVLRAMGRKYTSSEYAEVVSAARAAIPGVSVSTDVLVGFPGETDEQADNTLRFCRQTAFDRLHVFRYSSRPRTQAADRPDQIDPLSRSARARRMRNLDRQLREASAAARVGREREMLVEQVLTDPVSGALFAQGTTRDYCRVRLKLQTGNEGVAAGSLVNVVLGDLEDGVIAATLSQGKEDE